VWLLDEVMEGADGEKKLVTHMRPRRGGRNENKLSEVLTELEELGIEKAWTTEKYPFMAFLMAGIVPLIFIADPILFLLNLFGLP
jgi:hypothetical protein